MKLSHFIVCGLAAFVLPGAAFAEDRVQPTTLFPGVIDLPVAEGSNVPTDCQFPEGFSAATSLELACVVEDSEEAGMAYIAWLGRNGWRRGNDIIGGFQAIRETENGCEQVLNIFPHGNDDETTPGMWFALQREPTCAAASNTAQ